MNNKLNAFLVIAMAALCGWALFSEIVVADDVNAVALIRQKTLTDKQSKIRHELLSLTNHAERQSSLSEANHLVIIDVIAKSDPQALLTLLIQHGMKPLAVNGRIISGQIPVQRLDELDALEGLNEVKLSKIITSQGSVTTQGDIATESSVARPAFGVDGSGITVGVISDSYNCLGGAAQDQSTQDLPPQVTIMADALDCSGRTDEGRALMQIVHDIAPGAKLLFHSGENGTATTANAILKMVSDYKADIIVDDFKAISANFFQEDAVTQATQKAVKAGVVYVTAAGNEGRNAYQSTYHEYTDKVLKLNAHNFATDGSTDIYQRIIVPEGVGFNLMLQWDSPAYTISGSPGSQSDLDIFIFNKNHTRILAASTFDNIGKDPIEDLYFFNDVGSGETEFDIVITKASGALPQLMKYIILNSIDGIIGEYATNSSGIFGHADSASIITVGASNYMNTPKYGQFPALVEYYSSAGGSSILFDINGNRLSTPITNHKPDITAPDDVDTTFFGNQDTDNNGFPNIAGTSAAAPHVAGIAALLLQVKPTLQPVDIKNILNETAIDITQINNKAKNTLPTGFDFDSGYGLVNAEAAINLAKNYQPSIPPDNSDGNMGDITVNNPNQLGGGGAFDLFYIVALFVLLANGYFRAGNKHMELFPKNKHNL
ncbi:S8 family peptidase [Thiothrix subterranea]|uniref:S8 family serine peptidase n=1 Tax=Thiothrix subterranea TaxID=2735563 RepID=A0AA51MT38_9GAMM|nr:S8 family serine peptidase [Thiothrix subterranea]MDQ5767175.1 S8 family serine peptidase [Thiothrix subterranea]WML87962.1 S8 family serine peptidase [Thiothrix subterranea]